MKKNKTDDRQSVWRIRYASSCFGRWCVNKKKHFLTHFFYDLAAPASGWWGFCALVVLFSSFHTTSHGSHTTSASATTGTPVRDALGHTLVKGKRPPF
jgi:hypothetical protein